MGNVSDRPRTAALHHRLPKAEATEFHLHVNFTLHCGITAKTESDEWLFAERAERG